MLYKNLRRLGVPRKQIFRNVYVPKYNGKFTEVDLIVLSKKGLLVFECKNFYGRIYGDGRNATWYKCSAGKRYPFVNPVIQNAGHIKYLLKYFHKMGLLPAYSFIVVGENGDWRIKNIRKDICFVKSFSDFSKYYRGLNDSPLIAQNFYTIMNDLKLMERGSKGTRFSPRWIFRRTIHSLSVRKNSRKWKKRGRLF